MGILIIIFLLILVIVGLFLLFKTLKWVFTKKVRVVGMLLVLVFTVAGITINKLFFVKMEFIQSKVYPNLYLVKNPVENKKIVNKAIKEKVIQKMNHQFADENEKSNDQQPFTLSFYKYSKGDWGENGTAYFIEHKERRDGMLPELLEYYPEYLLAKFNGHPCKEDNSNYFGKLDYYKDRKIMKTDTLLNLCKK